MALQKYCSMREDLVYKSLKSTYYMILSKDIM